MTHKSGEEPEPISSSGWGVKWGWLSLGVPHYSADSRGALEGHGWYASGEAAKIAGVSSAALRRWATEGLLSYTHEHGKHRRYLRNEIEFIEEIGRHQKVTAPDLKACAAAMLYGFLVLRLSALC